MQMQKDYSKIILIYFALTLTVGRCIFFYFFKRHREYNTKQSLFLLPLHLESIRGNSKGIVRIQFQII